MEIKAWYERLAGNLAQVFVGKDDQVRLLAAALLSGGHVLLDDVPGLGKTRLARALATSLGVRLTRIQCTPDLLPSDIIGTSIFNTQDSSFRFRKGPLLNPFILVDEINRASPRTQAALLEAMAEKQVSVEGKALELPQPFFVIATQNPVDSEGTYPLPEAQKDRFLLTLNLGYPDKEEELKILEVKEAFQDPLDTLSAMGSWEELARLQESVTSIHVAPSIRSYIVDLCAATRSSAYLRLGASPRASLALFRASQCLSAIRGRAFVAPEDVQELTVPVLVSRLILNQTSQIKGMTPLAILKSIIESVPVPALADMK